MAWLDHCPDCGARVDGGRQGCQDLWDTMAYSATVLPGPAFDAYCMQHLERYCRSAKSYAAHLTRLCAGIEHDGDPRVFRALQRWLDGRVELVKPPILAHLGALTIADVRDAGSPEAQALRATEWVMSVWEAYRSQHELARQWIRHALGER
ncbi:MAG: hypothetical protein JNL26_15550 [Gemmatimonadetes bacterium]|nr:hypothetical protein [Gemmatimonadota bacterium]